MFGHTRFIHTLSIFAYESLYNQNYSTVKFPPNVLHDKHRFPRYVDSPDFFIVD